jgi:hypothetical protein
MPLKDLDDGVTVGSEDSNEREINDLRQHVDDLTRELNLFKLAFTSIAGTIKLVTPPADESAVRQALGNIVSTLRMVSDEFKNYRK